MDTKSAQMEKFRARSYGGAAACFALLPFLWPTASSSWLGHLALVAAACGLPLLVAAGWMADAAMLSHLPKDAAAEFDFRAGMFASGAMLLFLSVGLELVEVDLWTGGIFLAVCAAAAAAKNRHTRMIDEASGETAPGSSASRHP